MTKTWEAIKQPPKTALKQITGGRLNGFTDIKPQWRLLAMNETFGDVGFGWYFTIDKQWTEKADDGQLTCFCNVSVYVKKDDEWSKPIQGTGGSKICEKEKSGIHVSDEGFKMALTDALSVAMKSIGMGADVYMGYWDGKNFKPALPPEPAPSNPAATGGYEQNVIYRIRKADIDQLEVIGKELAQKYPNKTSPANIRNEYTIRSRELAPPAE